MIDKLRPCPFCGGMAALVESYAYDDPAVVARCVHCHAQTKMFIAGYDMFKQRQLTVKDVNGRAIQAWNSLRNAG